MEAHHCAVWIDHETAKLFRFTAETVQALEIHPDPNHVVDRRVTGGRREDHDAYYKAVTAALRESGELLIVGPAQAKLELVKYLHKHAHEIVDRLVGVETVDHPTDRQLLAYAKAYFKKVDSAV